MTCFSPASLAGNAAPGRAIGGFIPECAAIPAAVRAVLRICGCGSTRPAISTTGNSQGAARRGVHRDRTPQHDNVRAATIALRPIRTRTPALNADRQGIEIADTTITIGKTHRGLADTSRLIVRRQPTRHGDQLSLDDLDGWRFGRWSITSRPVRPWPT
ncbi:MAG: hypothetical protein R2713_10490 [Ilumatobacteraceae bacterium]